MQWMANFKMANKLGLLILVALVALGCTGFTGYYFLKESKTAMENLYNARLVPLQRILESRSNANNSNAAVLELMLTTDAKKNQELKDFIEQRTKQVSENLDAITKMHLDNKEKEILSKINEARQKYLDARGQVISLAVQNKNAEAYALYMSRMDKASDEFTDALREMGNYLIELSKQTDRENSAAFNKAMYISVGILFASFLLLGAFGWLVTKGVTGPLQQMVAFCHELARGNFVETERKVKRHDEIGQLADALADMRTKVRLVLKQVAESAELVGSSSEELTASSEQSSQAAGQVAESITSVANGANQQLVAVSETSAVVEQMSAGIQQIAANANVVAAQSAQASDKALSGGKAVERAVSQMGQIENTVNSSAAVVAKLGERSKEIGQIVDAISGIAGQTNLLALNAAIEAARAGEQGRGFAVVAEEVRKLAEQSEEAAKKISGLIGEIQADTDKAVVAMSAGTREVKTGAEVVNAAGIAFTEIAGLVTQVSDQVKEISAAIQQMATGSQQIVGSVKKIDELSKASAGESQSVSAATEEQLASMEEIAGASEALAKLAQDLQEAVAKFRV